MGLCYSLYDLRKEVEVVGRHGRGSSLLLVFNFFIEEKTLEILKGPSTCFRDRNKGEKLWDFFSTYIVERNIWSATTVGFTGGEGNSGPVVVTRELAEAGSLLRFMLAGGHRHPTDLVLDSFSTPLWPPSRRPCPRWALDILPSSTLPADGPRRKEHLDTTVSVYREGKIYSGYLQLELGK